MIARIAKEIPEGKKVMVTFGGGSVKKNGVYEQVRQALEEGRFAQYKKQKLEGFKQNS